MAQSLGVEEENFDEVEEHDEVDKVEKIMERIDKLSLTIQDYGKKNEYLRTKIICDSCGKTGHIARYCRNTNARNYNLYNNIYSIMALYP